MEFFRASACFVRKAYYERELTQSDVKKIQQEIEHRKLVERKDSLKRSKRHALTGI